MAKILLHNATIVNEGRKYNGYVGINGELIEIVGEGIASDALLSKYEVSHDLNGAYLIPGVIDDQVHFREPGLTHKADIESESKAAVAGGVTSYMDMPNTNPQTVTIESLEWKNNRAAEVSYANYGFFIGATNSNIEVLKEIDYRHTPGIKLFLGASTGNMLVDDDSALDKIFSLNAIVAIHSEDETIIRQNMAHYKQLFPDGVPISCHHKIRNEEACYKSTLSAIERAKRLNTRLHILHISTAKELELLTDTPLSEKRITAEVCVHHLWFTDADYERLGAKIKWNPAIKSLYDREALRAGVNNGKIDIVATDHAPHLWSEKEGDCTKAASGGPMVQHSLITMLELSKQDVFTVEKVVEMMCHKPAELFSIENRGFIREGYYADLAVVCECEPYIIDETNILTKCGWSPLIGEEFTHKVITTIVNGNVVYNNGIFDDSVKGKRLSYKVK